MMLAHEYMHFSGAHCCSCGTELCQVCKLCNPKSDWLHILNLCSWPACKGMPLRKAVPQFCSPGST